MGASEREVRSFFGSLLLEVSMMLPRASNGSVQRREADVRFMHVLQAAPLIRTQVPSVIDGR